MNTEEKIYSKIKNASHKGEKDFPGMDKVWNRVEEKLDNTIVVKKKNTWQKLAIAASVLLSFSIIYHFVSNDETTKKTNSNFNNAPENSIIVSNDSVNKIIEKAKEVVVDNETNSKPNSTKTYFNTESNPIESKFYPEATPQPDVVLDDTAKKIVFEKNTNTVTAEEKEINTTEYDKNLDTENKISYNNSALNSSSSNNGYLAKGKKYEAPTKEVRSKYKVASAKSKVATQERSDDIVVIDGVVKDKKELDNLNAEDIEVSHLKKPLYIINGIEYTEESLFGKRPTSPYAPLDKQEIITINVVKAEDAMKVYGKKGENGIVIITTKDGKPVKK